MQKNTDKILSPIKKRLSEYLGVKGIQKEAFYAQTGISASNFKGKGGESELGGEKIVRILTEYPELNADWLVLGRGSMLRDGQPAPMGAPSTVIYERDPRDVELIDTQRELIAALKRERGGSPLGSVPSTYPAQSARLSPPTQSNPPLRK